MEGVADFLKSWTERIKHPFLGRFSVSWIGFNWKFLYFLYFIPKADPIDNIQCAIQHYMDWWNGLLFPVLTAILIYPASELINHLVHLLSEKINSKRFEFDFKTREQQLDKTLLLKLKEEGIKDTRPTHERIINLQNELENLTQEVNDKNSIIGQLQSEKSNLTTQFNELLGEHSKFQSSLKETHLELAKYQSTYNILKEYFSEISPENASRFFRYVRSDNGISFLIKFRNGDLSDNDLKSAYFQTLANAIELNFIEPIENESSYLLTKLGQRVLELNGNYESLVKKIEKGNFNALLDLKKNEIL